MVGCWSGCLSGARCRLAYAQLMPLPLTVSFFSKIQIGFTFLVLAHPDSPGKRAVKRVCVCVCVLVWSLLERNSKKLMSIWQDMGQVKALFSGWESCSCPCVCGSFAYFSVLLVSRYSELLLIFTFICSIL